jgi:hypothetical protein
MASVVVDVAVDACEKDAAKPPDPLLPYLSTSTALGKTVRDAIMRDGYVVLRKVISAAECDRELSRMWGFVEAVSPTVSRDDPLSWFPASLANECGGDAGGAAVTIDGVADCVDGAPPVKSAPPSARAKANAAVDPWPHSGWNSLPGECSEVCPSPTRTTSPCRRLVSSCSEILIISHEDSTPTAPHDSVCSSPRTCLGQPTDPPGTPRRVDMLQNYQAGWLFSDLRELLAERVFEPVYGTRDLHCSKEGFTFHRPTAPAGRHPLAGKQGRFVCGRPSNTDGEHFDQRATDPGLHCIQSSTALTDQGPEDGCFRCWPGSHVHHPSLMAGKYRGNKDWVPITDAELEELAGLGLSPKRVPVQRGDVILWRSDLAHSGQAPGITPHFRAVTYSCMLPAVLTPAEAYPAKLEGYLKTIAGDHRPNVETGWHFSAPKRGGDAPVRGVYFPHPPELSWRQAEFYGLVRYSDDSSGWAVAKADAELQGVRFKSGAAPTMHQR